MAIVEGEQEEDDITVAAIGGRQQKAQWKKKNFLKGDRQQQQKQSGGQHQRQEKNAPIDLAIAASGLWRAHWFNREKAKGCSQGVTCSLQGN